MGITVVDSFNGVLVMNNWLSISKPYKFLILLLMLLRLVVNGKPNKYTLIIFLSFTTFFIGYFAFFISNLDFTLFTQNLIESTKYFIWPISFIYFRMLYLQNNGKKINFIILAFEISYFIVLFNILIGILGFGYEFYPRYSTGTKGFFFSGNEFSLLFLLLTYIMAWRLLKRSKRKYIFFCLISLFLAIKIGSKTAILGVFLLVILVGLSHVKFNLMKLSLKKAAILLVSTLFISMAGWFFVKMNKAYINDFIIKRLEGYNYELITWFLSKRNLVAIEGFKIFNDFNLFYKFFGIGEASFHDIYRMIEIDFVDLLMNHGYIGLTTYLLFIVMVFSFLYKNRNINSFSKFIFSLYILVVFILANMSGHIINTGIPGFFIGMILSMPYLEKDIFFKHRNHG